MKKTTKNLPLWEQPYEKFTNLGVENLSDADLIAIILRTGTNGRNVVDVAKDLLSGENKNLLNLYSYSFEELLNFPGIGKIKATQLKCMAELSKRISKTERIHDVTLNNANSVADFYMEQMRHLTKEQLMVAAFDNKGNLLKDEILSIGTINASLISVREVFLKALEWKSVYLILLHNHPSGNPAPSGNDIQVTKQLTEAGKILEIEVKDHIIIGDKKYFSFREHNMI